MLYINTERTQTKRRLILIEGGTQQRDWGCWGSGENRRKEETEGEK